MPKRKEKFNCNLKTKRKRLIVYSSSSDSEENQDDGTRQDETNTSQFPVSTKQHELPVPELAPDELPELDPEILSALGDTTDEKSVYGEKIHQTLAQRWIPVLKKGLSKDLKEKLLKEYQIPENCKLLKAPTLNPEVKAAVSEAIINRDKNIQFKQDQLGLGLAAMNKAITLLLLGDDKIQAIKIFSDSCRILTDLHYTETQVRAKLIAPCLDKSFTPMIKDHERDETLFGEKLSETIKASKAVERQGLQIKKPTQRSASLSVPTAAGASTARPRFTGNESGPPRYASASRGGRGYPRGLASHRRPATTSTRTPTSSGAQSKHRAHPRR